MPRRLCDSTLGFRGRAKRSRCWGTNCSGLEPRFLLTAEKHRGRDRTPSFACFALQNRVLLLRHPSGVGIDIALGALPFEESAISRAVMIEVESQSMVRLCTAEDLIVMKAFADRPIDWKDVRGIIVRQGEGALDWRYIRQHLQPLCEAKEQPEIMDRLEALRCEVYAVKRRLR